MYRKRADDVSGRGHVEIFLGKAGQSEVGDPEVAARIDQQVRGLDVAVDHAEVVSMIERKGGLEAEARRRAPIAAVGCDRADGAVVRERFGAFSGAVAEVRRPGRRTSKRDGCRFVLALVVAIAAVKQFAGPNGLPKAADDVREGSSVDELHRVVMEPVIEPGAENGHDVLVVQQRGGLGLELEPLPLARVERGSRGQDLERNAPAQRKLLGLINHAHPTAADLTEDPEFTEPGRWHRIGGGTEIRIRITDQAGSGLDQLESVDPRGQGARDRLMLRQEFVPAWPPPVPHQEQVLFECVDDPWVARRRTGAGRYDRRGAGAGFRAVNGHRSPSQ